MIITVNKQQHNAVKINPQQNINYVAVEIAGNTPTTVAGSQILNGAGVPTITTGVVGDYYIDTLSRNMYGPKTLSWGLPLFALGNTYISEEFVVTQSILDAKYITLQSTPSVPNEVELMIYGGIEQRHGVDFVLNGKVLSWNSLALELLLDLQTTFTVRYTT
jgi:hypothetical protein